MSEMSRVTDPVRLETAQPGLVLVQMLTPEDDEAYFELQNDNVGYWKEFGNSIDASVDQVTEQRLEHGNGRFGIWFDGTLVGMVGYSTKDHEQEAEIGILLAKDASGRGYAISAIKAITEYAKPRFDRVFAEVAPDNGKSIGLLNRSGYVSNGEIVERDWGKALVFEAPK